LPFLACTGTFWPISFALIEYRQTIKSRELGGSDPGTGDHSCQILGIHAFIKYVGL